MERIVLTLSDCSVTCSVHTLIVCCFHAKNLNFTNTYTVGMEKILSSVFVSVSIEYQLCLCSVCIVEHSFKWPSYFVHIGTLRPWGIASIVHIGTLWHWGIASLHCLIYKLHPKKVISSECSPWTILINCIALPFVCCLRRVCSQSSYRMGIFNTCYMYCILCIKVLCIQYWSDARYKANAF